jgi:hypothetical protein
VISYYPPVYFHAIYIFQGPEKYPPPPIPVPVMTQVLEIREDKHQISRKFPIIRITLIIYIYTHLPPTCYKEENMNAENPHKEKIH